MNELQAREILGCSTSASYKELRASYRRMITLVHPDKAGQDAISQERAKEASSRLNLSWEYIENREKQGLLGRSEQEQTHSFESSRGRATYPHECDVCGFAPATRISAPVVASFIYFFRRGTYDLNACKACGLAMSRIALRETMIKGWWGLGLIFVPHAVYRYFRNIRALSKIDLPIYRDPDVVTMSNFPFRVPKSPLREPLPLLASAIAITIATFLLFSGEPSPSKAQPSLYVGQVGSCYLELSGKVQMIDCLDSRASLTSIAVTDSDSLCPSGTLGAIVAKPPDGTTKFACLVQK